MHVALEQQPGRQGAPYQLRAGERAAPFRAHCLCPGRHPALPVARQVDPALVTVQEEIRPLDQLGDQRQCLLRTGILQVGGTLAADDERRARLVHQHAIGLVDDREVEAA